MTVSFEHADEVRAALQAIVSDPAHGADALSSPRVMASLLGDLLPDAPRESGLLVTAIQRDVAGMLREHVASGLTADVAINLAASSLARSTAFTPGACQWVAAELAVALGLAMPAGAPGHGEPGHVAEVTAAVQVSGHELPTSDMVRRPATATRKVQPSRAERPLAPSLPEFVPELADVPQPPQEPGWRLAVRLPGPYGTRDCPRCGRRLPRAAVGKPHVSPGRLWCPGIPRLRYEDRDGYLRFVTTPEEGPSPDAARLDSPQGGAAGPDGGAAQRLTEIARLHAAGLLTDQEYQNKRQEIIGQL